MHWILCKCSFESSLSSTVVKDEYVQIRCRKETTEVTRSPAPLQTVLNRGRRLWSRSKSEALLLCALKVK
jgi:hypothetical protein